MFSSSLVVLWQKYEIQPVCSLVLKDMYSVIFPVGSNLPILFVLLWETEILCFVKQKLPSPTFSCWVWIRRTVCKCYYMSFAHPLQSADLQSLLHCLLSFAGQHLVQVENYQVKFYLAEANHLKSILTTILAPCKDPRHDPILHYSY